MSTNMDNDNLPVKNLADHKNWRLFLAVLYGLLIAGLFFSLALLQVAGSLLAAIALWQVGKAVRNRSVTLLQWLLSGYFFSGVLAVLISPQPTESLPALMRHVLLLTILPIADLLLPLKKVDLRNIGITVTLLALAPAALGIFRHWSGVERTFGFYGGYFTLASLMAFTIPIVFGYFLSSRGWFRLLIIFSLHLQVAALWLTYTRSAFAGVLFGFGFWFVASVWFSRGQRTLRRYYYLFLSAAIPSALLFLIFTSPDPRINPLAKNGAESAAPAPTDITSGRVSIAKDALELLSRDVQTGRWHRVAVGHGLRSRMLLFDSPYKSWESDYLEVLMNQGVAGLLMILGIYFFLLRRIWGILRAASSGPPDGMQIGLIVSAMAFGVMSFFTLQLQGLASIVQFVLLFCWMDIRQSVD